MSSKHVYDCKHEYYTEEQRTFLQNLLRQKLWKHAPGLHVSDCQNFPGTPIPIQSLVKQMKWYEIFCTSKGTER